MEGNRAEVEANTARSSARTGNREVERSETGEEGSRRRKCRSNTPVSTSKYIQSIARMDMLNIQEHGHVVQKPKWRKHFEDETLEEMLLFIFLSTNVQLMAWAQEGSKSTGVKEVSNVDEKEINGGNVLKNETWYCCV